MFGKLNSLIAFKKNIVNILELRFSTYVLRIHCQLQTLSKTLKGSICHTLRIKLLQKI